MMADEPSDGSRSVAGIAASEISETAECGTIQEQCVKLLESFRATKDTIDKLKDMIEEEEDLMILKQDDINHSEYPKLTFRQRKKLWELIEQHQREKGKILQIEYTPGEKISPEKYGSSVFLCKRKADGKQFAAKRLMTNVYRNVQKEIEMVTRLDPDNNVVHYYGYCSSKDCYTIIMQLCGGDVGQLIRCKKNKETIINPIDQENGCDIQVPFLYHFDIGIGDILFQLVAGVKYLHTYKPRPIVHRDIKPSNFLLYKLKSGKTLVKIADFGLSRLAHSDDSVELTQAIGSYFFMAREYFDAQDNKVKPTTEADIFSLGLTLFYIFTEGTHVYGETDNHKNSLLDEKRGFDQALPREGHETETRMDGLSDEHRITFCDMIRNMLKHKPSERYNINDVDAHPTFWNSKKKSDFYWDVNKALESREKKDTKAKALDFYDEKLTTESKSEKIQLPVTLQIFPESCKNSKYPIKYDEDKRVVSLLKIMRDKKSHGDLSPEENKELGIETEAKALDGEEANGGKETKDARKAKGGTIIAINWDKFLDAFTGKVPQFLVHLYEHFREEEMQDKSIYYHCP